MSKLLIQESPVMIIPSLAVKIGLNEAVILQQIHYWVSMSNHVIEGRKWIYNTYKDWQQQFPFWSESTIKRTIHSLEKQGLLISGNWNRTKMDKTKWYTIHYEQLEALTDLSPEKPVIETEPFTRKNQPKQPFPLDDRMKDKTIERQEHPETEKLVEEVINYLNEKTFSSYKPHSKKTREYIQARIEEGFTLEDFKKVIDTKAREWLYDSVMCKYLRPSTLFGTNFESYLNQKMVNKSLQEEDFDLDE
ncbi:hypothetical protein HW35_01565 [Bacillus sp. X1(2014)]|nr:hypothetical protein HW35_01565 [Bacillus sp. X1(2014)]